jgi:hypothetical protein
MIGASVCDDTPFNISLTTEPLVRLLSIPDSLALTPDPPDEENDPNAMDIAAAVDAAENANYIEDIPRLYCARTSLADRRARGTEDKAAGQCRGDLGVSVDSLTILLDLAVADATARSYRRPPPAATTPEEPPLQENSSELLAPTAPPRRRGRRRQASRQAIPLLGGDTDHPTPSHPLAFRDSRLPLSTVCTRRSPSFGLSLESWEWKTQSAL